MEEFSEVREGDQVYGLVFGKGIVRTVFNGFYKFEVEYENDQIVPYSVEGIPGWNPLLDMQTVFYADCIDLMKFNIAPGDTNLKPKEIIKLRRKGLLSIKCPSGIWLDINMCPEYIREEYLENKKFYLFRRKTPESFQQFKKKIN